MSFDDLNTTCSSLYGALIVDSKTKSVPLASTNYSWTGCIEIEESNLTDVGFLEAFTKFVQLPNCRNYIRGNEEMCITNLEFILRVFVDIEIRGNKKRCGQDCLGGNVTMKYLEENEGCVRIFGDLSINGWTGDTAKFESLSAVETINGRLIIENNVNLHNFSYFTDLRQIGTGEEEGAVVIIKNNEDLIDIPLPQLDDISISENDSRVDLYNNPMLYKSQLSKPPKKSEQASAQTFVHSRITTKGKTTATVGATSRYTPGTFTPISRYTQVNLRRNTTSADWLGVLDDYKWHAIVGGVIFFVGIVLALALLWLRKQEAEPSFPSPSYKLKKKSEDVLISLCTDVLKKDPLVWCLGDGPLLRYPARLVKLAKDTKGAEKKLIALSPNALLPKIRDVYFDKYIQIRVQSFVNYDYVLLLSEGDEIEKTIKDIPKAVGEKFVYMDNPNSIDIMFVLLQAVTLSRNVKMYTYEIEELMKQKKKTLYMIIYRWPERRLPVDYDEMLQVVELCSSKKLVCVADRHKEVFSLLCLLHKEVSLGKKTADIGSIFQSHARWCNGAPLDRSEMLYVLRFILFWAGQCSCVPISLEKQYDSWCHIYGKMSDFAMLHPNIMSIHPRHILKNPLELEKTVNTACRSEAFLLSERARTPMVDKYKRKGKTRNKRKLNEADRKPKSKDTNEAIKSHQQQQETGQKSIEMKRTP